MQAARRTLVRAGLAMALGIALGMALMPARAGAAERLPVVASFSILADLVSEIGGARVSVTSLVGPDADAHVYAPAPQDVVRLARAQLLVVNGLGFEGWLARLAGAAGYRGVTVVASQGVSVRHPESQGGDEHGHAHANEHANEHSHEHAHAHDDPHAWQDPRNVMLYVANIAAALERVDPAGAAVYRANAAAYQARLRELDQWAAARFVVIAPASRRVITAHAAFNYLAARYDFQATGVQARSTGSEPSVRAMTELVRRMRRDGTRAVFVENLHNARLLTQLAAEAGVAVGPRLYSDALSGPGGPAPTYLAMMRYNVEQLVRGMQQN